MDIAKIAARVAKTDKHTCPDCGAASNFPNVCYQCGRGAVPKNGEPTAQES